jgi:peptide/nickel transport system permease protein
MPSFWLAILLILFFSVRLGVLPSEAPQSDSLSGILSQPGALILPVFVTSIYSIASLSRYMRSSTIENLIRDYVRTALSKGLSKRRVLFGHVMKNALLPIITMIGLSIPGLVSGSVIVETIFNYPGVGLLYDAAASDRDYPILLAVVLLASFATALGSLLADLLYVAANPQIRYQGHS